MTADERAALVERLRTDLFDAVPDDNDMQNVLAKTADLIEADGKRLALAEKTIDAFRDRRVESDGYAGHPDMFDAILDSYDAAKEGLS